MSRKFKTKRGVDHRIKNIGQKPMRRRKARHRMKASEKLAARQYRKRLKKRMTVKDKLFVRVRAKKLRARRRKMGSLYSYNIKVGNKSTPNHHLGVIRKVAKKAWKHPKTALALTGGTYVAAKVTKKQLDSRM